MIRTSRQALVISASALAIGVALPAYAQTTPGVLQNTVGADIPGVDLVISGAGETRTYGDNDVGDPTESASVLTVFSGQFDQSGTATGVGPAEGDAVLTISNIGTGTIRANAEAVNLTDDLGADNAEADAFISTAIEQTATGVETAVISVNNSGTLTILANADAEAIDVADANARIQYGIRQEADAANDLASAGLTNAASSVLSISSIATAAGLTAVAYASISQAGIYQEADGDAAATSVTNNGTLTISALSTATATGAAPNDADAQAYISNAGIYQEADSAENGQSAVTALTNNGPLTISAVATATAGGAAGDFANADASVNTAIEQYAYGDLLGQVTLTNNATRVINIVADADAVGFDASASANNYYGVYQYAQADDATGAASATVVNAGTLNIAAMANGTATAVTGDDADAYAYLNQGVYQDVAGFNGSSATATITNTGPLNVTAAAVALGIDNATASATIQSALYQNVDANGAGSASAVLTNSNTINVVATADADGGDFAEADAQIDNIISQNASATGTGNASVTFTNQSTGVYNVAATADALATTVDGEASADATAGTGIDQYATANDGDATATYANSGTFALAATATANGGADIGAGAFADASAAAYSAVYQNVDASNGGAARGLVTNSKTLSLTALATATDADAEADAYAGTAIYQTITSFGGGAAVADVANTGAISAVADALATGAIANADAEVSQVISQNAFANVGGLVDSGNATVTLSNTTSTGIITVLADADATATAGLGEAEATIEDAITQQATSASGNATATLTNARPINVTATADGIGTTNATGDAGVDIAIDQNATAVNGVAGVTLANNTGGAINVAATGNATAEIANATANVGAVVQTATGESASATFNNAATFNVDANADANAAATGNVGAFATADAIGLIQQVNGTVTAGTLNFANSGTFTVDALVDSDGVTTAQGTAFAGGYGVFGGDVSGLTISNSGTFTVQAVATADGVGAAPIAGTASAVAGGIRIESADAAGIAGTITNSGTLTVLADARGDVFDTASANGITLASVQNTATLTNTGTVRVTAVSTDGNASANAIVVDDLGGGVGVGTFTLNNNGGTIVARESVNGTTFTHGVAIDTSDAPNPVVINLRGGAGTAFGSIYGDIDLSDDDVINVREGETRFDGTINAPGQLDGDLNILSGGTLYLQYEPTNNPSNDGPAMVYIDDLTIAAGGTLALQLPSFPTAGAAAVGTYPQIFADTATITGATLEVRPSSSNGLYGNSTTYDNIIDANTRTGTFGTVRVAGGTPLLTATATYDAANNVDLAVNRVAFGAVAGLGINQTAVGNGIESVYSPTLTGPFATLLGTLFTQNAATYADSLDQLTGAQYAGYLQSMTGLGERFNGLLSQVGRCAATVELRQTCRSEAAGRIWGQFNYGRVTKDGDFEAPGYRANQYYAALGIDFDATPDLVLGIGGAYVKNDLDFDRRGGRIDMDGFQVGAYAVYAPGPFYLKGVVSYTDLNGDSRREVNIGTTSGVITGKPGARAWTVSGEAGVNLGLGGSTVTPFVGLDYTNAKLKGFAETGVAAANLRIVDSEHERVASTLGLRWTGDFGGIVPEIEAGWRHQFGDPRATFNASFDVIPGSNFSIVSQLEKRDSAFIGAAIYGSLGGFANFRLGYQGRFNGDLESHTGGVTLIVPFGRRVEEVIAPPPPPPAPVPAPAPVEAAPPPPPPPPAPTVGERG